jgi:hypothetical protein
MWDIYETIPLWLTTSGHDFCHLAKTTLSPLSMLIMSLRLFIADSVSFLSTKETQPTLDTSPSFGRPPQWVTLQLHQPIWSPHERNSDATWTTRRRNRVMSGEGEGRNSNAALELRFIIRQVLSRVVWTGEGPKNRSSARTMDALTIMIIHSTKINIVHWNFTCSKPLSNYLVNFTQRNQS